MISLYSYESLEDAWIGGVADWCQAASRHVLAGGRAWMVAGSDGQANWIKRRLLRAGVSLFGLQFVDAGSLRQELCQRRGFAPSRWSRDILKLTLRLRALDQAAHPELTPVIRHPGACLRALEDFTAAGWLEDAPAWRHEILPPALDDWLAQLRHERQWPAETDLALLSSPEVSDLPPLALCIFGWDAAYWPHFHLLRAAANEAEATLLFAPLPRGSSHGVQEGWLTALEEAFEQGFDACPTAGFSSSQANLINRLEGSDLQTGDAPDLGPELLVGLDADDTSILARDFVARWLTENDGDTDDARLVILSPRRDLSAVALLRSLAAVGIDVEDELGEVPEPSLGVQIQRAILSYYQERYDIETLIAIVELLNEHVEVWDGKGGTLLRGLFPLSEAEVRRLLHSAFGEVQHHSVRVLRDVFARARSVVAQRLQQLIDHLGEWPERLGWADALRRWEHCLEGIGLTTELLEPLWSQLHGLPIDETVPAAVFFQFLTGILECAPARRSPDGSHRYARVVLTTLDGALGQSWGAALFLDSNEGAWPLYPEENAFLDDSLRARLNAQRTAYQEMPGAPCRGHLLTSADQAQLEHFRFMEILGNCTGPVAFAGLARDATNPGQELYANEWALRCLLETTHRLVEGEKLLDRWHAATRRTKRTVPALPKADREHLESVFAARRDGGQPFDEYAFNFSDLIAPDELPWTVAWSARELATAWNQPATFALRQMFGATPAETQGRALLRGEGWMVGRLVHQWLPTALGAGAEPREMTGQAWHHALTEGLAQARRATESELHVALARHGHHGTAPGQLLPLWWRSTLQKAHWSAVRCLEGLAALAQADNQPVWLSQNRRFHGEVGTPAGRLRLQASCDVVLSDRPTLADAACQLIDIRTGSVSAATPSAERLAKGDGLDLTTLLSLALAEGAQPEKTRVGVVGPDAVNAAVLTAEAALEGKGALERLARQQHALNFGQRDNHSSDQHRDGETLPMATVPIDPAVLARKFAAGDPRP